MDSGIIYRKATAQDVVKLSILFKQVYIQTYGVDGVSDEFANFIVRHFSMENLEKKIASYPDNIIVAVYHDNLVGVVEIEFGKTCPVLNILAAEINKLYILERFCGKGIGYNLLRNAEETVRAKGINKIWLLVFDQNDRAIAFYERQNYKHIGEANDQMEVNNYTNKVMLKRLY